MNTSQKPDALRLADKYEAHGFLGDHRFAQEHWCRQAATELRSQHARIAELEAARIAYASEFEPDAEGDPDVGNIHANIRALKAQLSAIGAGGVEPLRKRASTAHHAEGVPEQVVELEVDDLIDRLLNAQQDLNLAANVHMDQSIASASTLLDEVEIALRALSATHATQQGMEQPIKWPKARDVGRFGDMSPDGSIRVGLDADNDVYVSICDGTSVADIEFCTPGGGGGRSSRTRMALIALMCAIEADNASHPAFDFWQRNLAAQAKQGE